MYSILRIALRDDRRSKNSTENPILSVFDALFLKNIKLMISLKSNIWFFWTPKLRYSVKLRNNFIEIAYRKKLLPKISYFAPTGTDSQKYRL